MLYSQAQQFSLKEYLAQKPVFVWIVIFFLVITGIGVGSFGVYTLIRTNDQEVVTSNDIQAQVCEQTADFGQITVYVSGGVVNPGVYVLETGDRLVDVLAAAGGIAKTADKSYINRQFNLAEPVHDGQQIYIPTADEVEKQLTLEFSKTNGQAGGSGGSSGSGSGAGGAGSGASGTSGASGANQGGSLGSLISINSSPKSELLQLSGIGEVRATKIIENRPYSSLQELVEKSVLSQSLFDELKSKLSL